MQRRLTAILSADAQGYSRLMGRDEAGTVRRLNDCRGVIEAGIVEHGGRVVDSPGDNLLAEFGSVVEAVAAAVEIQRELGARNDACAEDERMEFRMGINLGDVIVEANRLYGDGVNVAARLEALAEGGGICVSGDVYRQVEGKLPVGFKDLGARELKNIARPVKVYRIELDGPAGADRGSRVTDDVRQEIRFCTASDGVTIAYAAAGEGPPLVKTANWLNHLEYDWKSPVWRHLLEGLTDRYRLIRYDARGNGLSDRDVEDISFEAFVRDLETVVDAAGVERFPLLGISQGCAVSIAYAVRHPERVTRLILYGGYARGAACRGTDQSEQAQALLTLIRQGWGGENPAFRQIWTSRFMPEATAEQMQWFNDLQRVTASPENAARIRAAINDIQVEALLPDVRAPALVLHCRGDAAVPFEEGRRMAAGIPRARFVELAGRNHLILGNEAAWPRFLEEVTAFLSSPEASGL